MCILPIQEEVCYTIIFKIPPFLSTEYVLIQVKWLTHITLFISQVILIWMPFGISS